MRNKPIRKTVELPGELWEEIEEFLKSDDSDFSKICRKAIRLFLNDNVQQTSNKYQAKKAS